MSERGDAGRRRFARPVGALLAVIAVAVAVFLLLPSTAPLPAVLQVGDSLLAPDAARWPQSPFPPARQAPRRAGAATGALLAVNAPGVRLSAARRGQGLRSVTRRDGRVAGAVPRRRGTGAVTPAAAGRRQADGDPGGDQGSSGDSSDGGDGNGNDGRRKGKGGEKEKGNAKRGGGKGNGGGGGSGGGDDDRGDDDEDDEDDD